MTLREYFLENFDEDPSLIFDSDQKVLFAEDWDADKFSKAVLHTELENVPKCVVLKAFNKMFKSYEKGYEITEKVDIVRGNSIPLPGGLKRLNLVYNENFELPNVEEE